MKRNLCAALVAASILILSIPTSASAHNEVSGHDGYQHYLKCYAHLVLDELAIEPHLNAVAFLVGWGKTERAAYHNVFGRLEIRNGKRRVIRHQSMEEGAVAMAKQLDINHPSREEGWSRFSYPSIVAALGDAHFYSSPEGIVFHPDVIPELARWVGHKHRRYLNHIAQHAETYLQTRNPDHLCGTANADEELATPTKIVFFNSPQSRPATELATPIQIVFYKADDLAIPQGSPQTDLPSPVRVKEFFSTVRVPLYPPPLPVLACWWDGEC